ncbi:MAG: hypothetical protein ABI670_04365 [Chloroflexota bacterium]
MAAKSPHSNRLLGQITLCGAILIVGYIGLFCILQAPPMWYSQRPDTVRSPFPDVFGPINALFPMRWVMLDRDSLMAQIITPLYLGVVALITVPVFYLLRKLPKWRYIVQADRKRLLLTIFGVTLLIMVILMFVRGLLSSDIYSYFWYSRIWVDHGASPYTNFPREFALPADPEGSIAWVFWQTEPSVYGPAWLYISGLFYKLGQWLGGSFSAQILSLKLLADIAHLVNGFLVWSVMGLILAKRPQQLAPPSLVRKLPRQARPGTFYRPAQKDHSTTLGLQTAALLFYLWNPLLLVEFAANGHNDVVMITFVLLALWLHLKGWWRFAALALAVAALVKLPALLFIPGYLWLLFWNGVRSSEGEPTTRRFAHGVWRGVQALAVILVTWAVLYMPVWEGARTLQAAVSGPANKMYTHSLPYVLWWNVPDLLTKLLHPGSGTSSVAFMAHVREFVDANVRMWFLCLFVLIAIALTWRARTFSRTLIAWGFVVIAFIMAQGWFWPWYVSWVIPIAALAPSRRLRIATWIFSITSLLHYTNEQILQRKFSFFLDWSGVLIMMPPLAYMLGSWLLEVQRTRQARLSTVRAGQKQRSKAQTRPELAR